MINTKLARLSIPVALFSLVLAGCSGATDAPTAGAGTSTSTEASPTATSTPIPVVLLDDEPGTKIRDTDLVIEFGDPAFSFTDTDAADNGILSGRIVIDKFIDNYATTEAWQENLQDSNFSVWSETAYTITLVHITMGVSTKFGPDGFEYGEAFNLQDGHGHFAEILRTDEAFTLDAAEKGIEPLLLTGPHGIGLRVKGDEQVSGWIPFVTTTDHSKLDFSFSSDWGGVVDLTSGQ